MPDYLAPGVYVEEIERGPAPIVGVPTSTAAFIGETERGSTWPQLVTSYADFRWRFGESCCAGNGYLPRTIHGFFENGGKRLYVCRIVGPRAVTAARVFGDYTVRAVGAGAWGNRVWVKVSTGSTDAAVPGAAGVDRAAGFRLQAAWWSAVPQGFVPFDPFDDGVSLPRPDVQEDFGGLQLDPLSPDHYEARLRQAPVLVQIERSDNGAVSVSATVPAAGEGWLEHGADATNAVGAEDYVGLVSGDRAQAQGLAALSVDSFRDVALVYAPYPPMQRIEVARAVIEHCEQSQFRFAVIDGEPAADDPAIMALDPRTAIADSAHAAFYHPWLEVSDPLSGASVHAPPGGHVLGIYARTDTERGVHKAPANEVVRGALGLEFNVNEAQQSVLTPRSVNVLRQFEGRGIRVWGARTLSSDPTWRYVPVRRLFSYLERSIGEGTRWVAFMPNDERLWRKVIDAIESFLLEQWRIGALLGRKAEEAFFVRCDRTTMTQDDIDRGRLICEIGVAAVRPAEFVIFRLEQRTAEA